MTIMRVAFLIIIVILSRLTAYQYNKYDAITIWTILFFVILGMIVLDELEK